MNLESLVYSQEGISQVLNHSGIGTNGMVLLPWGEDQLLVQDQTGNTLGYVGENVHGGFTFSDTSMNPEVVTMDMGTGSQSIMDSSFSQTGSLHENGFGGSNLYDQNMGLETISFDSPMGESLFTNDMSLLGVTSIQGDSLHFSSTGQGFTPTDFNISMDSVASGNQLLFANDFLTVSQDMMFDPSVIEDSFSLLDWL